MRRHDLDAVRAGAMLLGIALHASLSFFAIGWMVQDREQAPWMWPAFASIHGFRMPLFFLLSGFFTAMLWRRRGVGGLLRHRTKRIALPLALGCMIIVPLMWTVGAWAGRAQASERVESGDAADGDAASSDIWTAAAEGDLVALRARIADDAGLDEPDPNYRTTPLGWATLMNQSEAVEALLDAGADPRARYGGDNTALHTAAFLGRADAARLLLDAGAELDVRNANGETPIDSMSHNKMITQFITRALQLPDEFETIEQGREEIRALLASRGGAGLNEGVQGAGGESGGAPFGGSALRALMAFPFFSHLWFLWFLCWFASGFALVVGVLRVAPTARVPSLLVATPLCLLWLTPLTMTAQSFMRDGGRAPGFGPDTSAGIVPIPHVLAYYAIFFGFGALLFAHTKPAARIARQWWWQLPLALVVFPIALGLSNRAAWTERLGVDDATLRTLSNLSEVLYSWLMVFGVIGLCEVVLRRERHWVRYLSDSSYWLYLVHLPLIVAAQVIVRSWETPALVKFCAICIVVTAILLVSYQWCVRYTPIGLMLNGRRTRTRHDPSAPHEAERGIVDAAAKPAG